MQLALYLRHLGAQGAVQLLQELEVRLDGIPMHESHHRLLALLKLRRNFRFYSRTVLLHEQGENQGPHERQGAQQGSQVLFQSLFHGCEGG